MKPKLEHHLLKVGGKYYKVKSKDGIDYLEPVNKKDVLKKVGLANKLAGDLKYNLDREKVMREALMKIGYKDLKQLEKLMYKSKRQYKPKTREGACADMRVGKFIIPIVD